MNTNKEIMLDMFTHVHSSGNVTLAVAAEQLTELVRKYEADFSHRHFMFTRAKVISQSCNDVEFRVWNQPFTSVECLIDSGGQGLVASCRGSSKDIDALIAQLDFLEGRYVWHPANTAYKVTLWLGRPELG